MSFETETTDEEYWAIRVYRAMRGSLTRLASHCPGSVLGYSSLAGGLLRALSTPHKRQKEMKVGKRKSQKRNEDPTKVGG
jgi:hypothetical protein